MRTESLDFLKRLVNTPSPSGNELRGQRVWLDYAKQFADETYWDAYGNCVAVLNKGRTQQIDTPHRIYDDPANIFASCPDIFTRGGDARSSEPRLKRL